MRCLCGSLAQEAEPLPIIDTHQHLWDLERFELPWVASRTRRRCWEELRDAGA